MVIGIGRPIAASRRVTAFTAFTVHRGDRLRILPSLRPGLQHRRRPGLSASPTPAAA
jgi:hypothetical protein